MEHFRAGETKGKPFFAVWENSLRRSEWMDLRGAMCKGPEGKREQTTFTKSPVSCAAFNPARNKACVCC